MTDAYAAANLRQLGVDGRLPCAPITCANRDDGRHGREGGVPGVLIATSTGWVCPYCDHAQPIDALPVAPIAMFGAGQAAQRPDVDEQRERIAYAIAAYRELAAQGARGAAEMLHALSSRDAELDAPAKESQPLMLWTVYANPSDYPGEYVARRSIIRAGRVELAPEVVRAASLEALRRLIPAGLHRIERDPSDDPVIVEVWV